MPVDLDLLPILQLPGVDHEDIDNEHSDDCSEVIGGSQITCTTAGKEGNTLLVSQHVQIAQK